MNERRHTVSITPPVENVDVRRTIPDRPRLRRVLAAALAAVGMVTVCLVGGAAWWVRSLGPPPRVGDIALSAQVLDRNGRLLRAYATSGGPLAAAGKGERGRSALHSRCCSPTRTGASATHGGVDPLAMLRAAWQLLTNGRVVSGGSTLTMQVARLLEPRPDRTLGAKLRQMVRAIEIERRLSKDKILALYLTLAPYGGNLEGIRAASLAYFGKEPRKLSLGAGGAAGGAAAIAGGAPARPLARGGARGARPRARPRRGGLGIPADEIAHAKREPVPAGRRPMPMLAPHAADEVMAAAPQRNDASPDHRRRLQKRLEELARERARALGPELSVAIVAVDNATGEVLARVASADLFR